VQVDGAQVDSRRSAVGPNADRTSLPHAHIQRGVARDLQETLENGLDKSSLAVYNYLA